MCVCSRCFTAKSKSIDFASKTRKIVWIFKCIQSITHTVQLVFDSIRVSKGDKSEKNCYALPSITCAHCTIRRRTQTAPSDEQSENETHIEIAMSSPLHTPYHQSTSTQMRTTCNAHRSLQMKIFCTSVHRTEKIECANTRKPKMKMVLPQPNARNFYVLLCGGWRCRSLLFFLSFNAHFDFL